MSYLYQEPQHCNIETIRKLLLTHHTNNVAEMIIGLALSADDRQQTQQFIIDMLCASQDSQIINACIKALSHIVRIDKNIDKFIFTIIDTLQDNPEYSHNIHDLLDDLAIYYQPNNKNMLINQAKQHLKNVFQNNINALDLPCADTDLIDNWSLTYHADETISVINHLFYQDTFVAKYELIVDKNGQVLDDFFITQTQT